jgi:hypothetical protein
MSRPTPLPPAIIVVEDEPDILLILQRLLAGLTSFGRRRP